jgi:hypothetical protein
MKKPSVTDICKILDKPALLKWKNKLGLEGIDLNYYQNSVLNRGIKKHKEIEDFLLNGTCIENKEIQERVYELFKDCEIISIEESFENKRFKGRCDIRFKKDGLNYIGDFKSKFKKPYLEHYLQLIMYKMHFNSDRICIIDLKEYEIHEITTKNEKIYIKIIINLINIFNLKQLI